MPPMPENSDRPVIPARKSTSHHSLVGAPQPDVSDSAHAHGEPLSNHRQRNPRFNLFSDEANVFGQQNSPLEQRARVPSCDLEVANDLHGAEDFFFIFPAAHQLHDQLDPSRESPAEKLILSRCAH